MGRLKEYFKNNPFLLAHHPSCDTFSNHTLNIRGWKLCLGCFVIYPSAIISLALLFFLQDLHSIDYLMAFYIALAMFGINSIRKIIYKDNLPKSVQVVFRVILGISLASMLYSIWLAPQPEQYYLIALFLAIAIGYNIFNSKKMLKTCKECDQYQNFPKCEGLNNIK